MKRSTAVLVLGYSRPEFVKNRLEELSLWVSSGNKVYVSIDGSKKNADSTISKDFDYLEDQFPQFNWIRRKENLGLVNHLTTQIEWCLETYENVVIVEDDISISLSSLSAIDEVLSEPLDPSVMTVGLFGSLPANAAFLALNNRWRKSRYFSAWGWGIQREAWSLYSPEIVKQKGLEVLNKSNYWRELNNEQRRRWIYRFSKVKDNPRLTWDYQMQFISFANDLVHILPKYRLCDNVGFGDLRATNTTEHRPRWYRGKMTRKTPKSREDFIGQKQGRLLEIIDSYTWIGDRNLMDRIRNR